MKFSVIIPCYNAGLWLEQTLNSVLQQTYPATEILVVDDGSTDNSVAIVEKVAATSSIPIRLLYGDRLGPAGARNVGIDLAIGDWIAFLDADDWWKPEHLQRIEQAIRETHDVVYLAAAEHFSITANRVVSMSDVPFEDVRSGIQHQAYFELYLKHGILEFSGCAIERQRLIEVGGLKSEFRGAEDMDVILRAAHDRTLTYDPFPSSYYRCSNPNSHSKTLDVNGNHLTAAFHALCALQHQYEIPQALLSQRARSIVSKAIEGCSPDARKRVLVSVWAYLSKPQKIIFSVASHLPNLYTAVNGLRNIIRGPQYPPRKEIQSDS
jgi:glycosyltransferase involved in cell wall biosynthesis